MINKISFNLRPLNLIVILCFVMMIFVAARSKRNGNDAMSYFEKKIYVIGTDTLPYLIHFPKNYSNTKMNYPVLIYLHGAGERGNDNEKQLTIFGNNFQDIYKYEKFPAICILPQCPKEKKWVDMDWRADSNQFQQRPTVQMNLLQSLFFTKIVPENRINLGRVYITGLSMGGFGTWDMIIRYPGIFTAAVPVCGGGDEKTVNRIQKTSIYTLHGTKDKLVKVSRSRNMVNACLKQGKDIQYKEFPSVGHNAWDSAYGFSNIIEWMFSKEIKREK